MKGERSSPKSLLRRKRVLIPLLALAALVILGLGGYKGITSFAMDEMTGFLVGTGGRADDGLVVKAGVPGSAQAARPAATPETRSGAAPEAAAVAGNAPAEAPSQPVSRVEAAVVEAPVMLAQGEPAAKAREATLELAAAPASAPGGIAPAPAEPGAVRAAEKAYTASFLRDPFFSLVQAGKDRPSKLLDVGRAKMVGSVWGEAGIIALLEDDTGRSYALKVGDRVLDGRVISITPASITFSITVFGLTKSVTLELAGEGE
jgi:hypothetical protein